MSYWNRPVDDLIDAIKKENLWRAYIITEPKSGEVMASHPVIQSVADAVAADTRDYRGHEGCFFEIGRESDHLLSAHVHWTMRGQAAGGVRYWSYDQVEDFVRDGLRLSRGMGQKNALAGLWWGGGKGVVARRKGLDHRDSEVRRAVYLDYGRFMTGLCGCYVTAEDAGTMPDDMVVLFSKTRHTTCIPQTLGGSGNPSVLTATGVVVAMEAALEHLGRGSLEGKTVVMQGLGNVSLYMVKELVERKVAKIVGADINQTMIDRVKQMFPDAPLDARLVPAGDVTIFGEAGDVFAPNAVGAILNPQTIPMLNTPIVCGAANNQLEDPDRDDDALFARDILYVPDFLANRMGIVNCANEQYGSIERDPAIYAHLERETPTGIYRRCMEVFARASSSGRTPADEASDLADELSQELHPVWGNRGQQIIDDLVGGGWAENEPIR
ncbi:MAG: Glu/Leu/Phe/Val dehydrogenase [Candidatus Latescibacterota bacterium]|nr:MAG: Glu/Leu/Phe/Val dehydrogenase [Candidatus Latescibacterota bacterium]